MTDQSDLDPTRIYEHWNAAPAKPRSRRRLSLFPAVEPATPDPAPSGDDYAEDYADDYSD